MTCLYLLCGTVGTGKTTYARKLEEEGRAVLFSADEWMIHFFGTALPRDEFDRRLDQCKEMIYRTTEKLLNQGLSVVLDFGFWKRSERDSLRKRFARYEIRLLYFKLPEDEILRRLAERNRNLPEYSYEITEEMYRMFSARFDPPSEAENPLIINR